MVWVILVVLNYCRSNESHMRKHERYYDFLREQHKLRIAQVTPTLTLTLTPTLGTSSAAAAPTPGTCALGPTAEDPYAPCPRHPRSLLARAPVSQERRKAGAPARSWHRRFAAFCARTVRGVGCVIAV